VGRLLVRLGDKVITSKLATRWLDEGSSPWRIGVGTASFVVLVVTIIGYATHPHAPGAAWWVVAFVVVIAFWAITEAVRGRIRYNRLQRQLADVQAQLNAPPAVKPLQPRGPYQHSYHLEGRSSIEYRVGIRNPAGNRDAEDVRLVWTGIEPTPDVEEQVRPNVQQGAVPPRPVPKLNGGDPSGGIDLPAGREEMWVVLTAVLDGVDSRRAGPFRSPASGGDFMHWWGTLWKFKRGDQWRLTYRITAANRPTATFSIVVTWTVNRNILACRLEG
jgi:hypothetical protein